MIEDTLLELQFLLHLGVALKNLDRIPALLFLRQAMYGDFFNVGKCMFHRTGEAMLRDGLRPFGGCDGCLCGILDSLALQGGDLYHFAAELTAELPDIDVVTLPADQIHHVQSDNHRNPDLHQLRR